MDISVTLLFGLLLLSVLWLWRKKYTINTGTIPGPIGLPILGYLPFLTSKPYVKFQQLAKKYGPVFSVKFGSMKIIVVDDFETTKAAFSQDACIGRPPELPYNFNKATLDTWAYTGLPWKEQRRFSIQMLKDLGFGKSQLENMIKEEIADVLGQFEQFEGRPTTLRTLLSPSVSNNIGSLVFGRRLPLDDPDRARMDGTITEAMMAAGQTAWRTFFPWAAKALDFLGLGSPVNLVEITKFFKDYVRNAIDLHKRHLEKNNPQDYIDGYLVEIEQRNDPAFCTDVLEDMIGILFSAGSETVRLTIEWLLLTAAAFPEVQRRVQSEIDDVIGRSRLPSWSDHNLMPFTQATICELMRWKTALPLHIIRYVLRDTELNGFFVPQHSCIMANLWSVHHDVDYWGPDADAFRPDRFLTEDGKDVKKFEHFIPFSIGKRSCPGEGFAKQEIFLYFVSFLQKFSVSLPAGHKPDFEGQLGISLVPKLQELCLHKRL